MILNPIESRVGSLMNVDFNALRTAIIDEELFVTKGLNSNILSITEGDDLPVLKLPVIVSGDIVIDIRSSIRAKDKKITNQIALDRLTTAATMMDLSIDNLDKFKGFYVRSIQMIVGERVRRSLVLTVEDVKYLNNLLCIYALSQFVDYSLEEKVQISKNFIIGEQVDTDILVKSISASSGDVVSLEDVFAVLKYTDTISTRLKKLDRDVLTGIMSSIVFGDSVPFLLAGLEVPSLWIALIHTHTTERIYSKTILTKIVKDYSKTIKLDDHMKLVKRAIKEIPFNYTEI